MELRRNSYERGCKGKVRIGRHFTREARKMSLKHRKSYGVYQCSQCGGRHLTTKLDNQEGYPALLFVIHHL